MEQLLQQAGAERTVDVFKAALQQSQACALMTPTLVRGDQGKGGERRRLPQPQAAPGPCHPCHHQVAPWATVFLPRGCLRDWQLSLIHI